MDHPPSFLNVITHEFSIAGNDLAMCAGYERGKWRSDQLADHVIEWLPEFALNHSDLQEIGFSNAVRMTKKAAKIVYQTEKYGKRGEFGELLLHIVIRQIYDTIPAVSKIYYKSSTNKTVEGFDAVHVVRTPNGLELWIGETKFYSDLNRAINDVSKEIIAHLKTNYLRSEFLLIKNKIDPNWPEAKALTTLLDDTTSLDDVFKRACIPILLTYDSKTVMNHSSSNAIYIAAVKEEITKAFEKLRKTINDKYLLEFKNALPIAIHAIFIPLHEKKSFIAALDKRLKALQI